MNGTSRPEAARTQHTQKDTPGVGGPMIEVGSGTLVFVAALALVQLIRRSTLRRHA